MSWKGQLWFWALTLAWVGIVAALFVGFRFDRDGK